MHRYSPHLVPALIILGAVLAVYSGAFGNEFLVNWDDPAYVAANPDIQAFTLDNLRKIFTSFYVGNYAPLQMLSYMFDFQLWGADSFGFILTNVLLHGLNGILFYLILCRLGVLSDWWALLAALLFVVHPVQVESVAWISQRKNVLAMTFFLSAFWQYLAFTRQGARRWAHFAAANLCFLAALLTKSVVVILPAVLLVYDFTLREGRGRLSGVLAEKVPFALLSLGASWLTLISQGEAVVGQYHGGSLFATVITMLTVFKKYLLNLVWPLRLSAVYLEDFKVAIDAEVVFSAALLVATVATLLVFRREHRRMATFWLSLFFLGLVPVSQVVPMMTLMNDRYLYFPLLGLSVYLLLLLRESAERFRLQGRVVFIVAAACVVLLAPVSWLRTGVWANAQTLWQDAVAKQPASAWAWSQLGYSCRVAGDIPSAVASYRKALAIDPDYYGYYYELGRIYHQEGDFDNAIRSYRKAVELNPDYSNARNNLALVYTVTLQHQSAVDILKPVAWAATEKTLPLLSLLAANYYYLGDYADAWRAYEEFWRRSPESTGVAGMLALVALRTGERETSRRLWQTAVGSGIDAADIYLDWARVEAVGHRREAALDFLARALSIGVADRAALYDDPDFASLRDDAEFIRMVGR